MFKVTLSGAETVLYSFTGGTDGSFPTSPLLQGSDGSLYASNAGGAANGNGELFKLTPSASLTTIYPFNTPPDGNNPYSLIVASDGTLYGLTGEGGSSNLGSVFKISPSGVETVLHSFLGLSDGQDPGLLVQGVDGNLYGTAFTGGSAGWGTVFKITPAGTFTVLYTFPSPNGVSHSAAGASPADLFQDADGNLYGTTQDGGSAGSGTVYQLTPTGVAQVLYSFQGTQQGATDGTFGAALIRGSDGNFYGTTTSGGSSAEAGTVFQLTPAGVEKVLYTFKGHRH